MGKNKSSNRKLGIILTIIFIIIIAILFILIIFIYLNENNTPYILGINLPKPIREINVANNRNNIFGEGSEYRILEYNQTSIDEIKKYFDWLEAVPIDKNQKVIDFLNQIKQSPESSLKSKLNIDKYYPNFGNNSLYYEENNWGEDSEGYEIFMILNPNTNQLYIFKTSAY